MQASREANEVRMAKKQHDSQDLRARLQAKRDELAAQRARKKAPKSVGDN
jgi:hypothetical protein